MKDETLRALREPHDESRAHRNWEAIQERRGRRGRRPEIFWGVGLAATLVTAIAVVIALRPAAGPLRAEGTPLTGALVEARVELDDGSSIDIDEGTHLEVLENDGERMRFWLHEGDARFDVTPGGPRRWVIESGQVSVEVLGTSFRVVRTPTEVRVSVVRGVVLVRGPTTPGGLQRLGAGDAITVPSETAGPSETAAAEIGSSAVAPREVAHEPAPSEPAGIEPAPRESAGSEPASSEPVRAADPSAEPRGERASVPNEAEASARLAEADALRARGDVERALSVLHALSRDPSSGHDGALAAFTAGRLELERARPRAAAESFAWAIERGLGEPLLEDARARRVEALAQAGELEAARRAARDYLEHHPDGRWRSEVERWSAAP